MIESAKQWLPGAMSLLTLFLISMVIGVVLGGNTHKAKPRVVESIINSPGHEPGIRMVGVKAEVTEDGQRLEHFTARTGRFNSDRRTLLMDDLAIELYRDGKSQGKATSPRGRMWLADDAANNARQNDLLLLDRPGKPVEYLDPRLGTLHSNRIYYYNKERLLRSGPYERMFQWGANHYRARGTQLDVRLSTGTTELKQITERGRPGIVEKIDKKDNKS